MTDIALSRFSGFADLYGRYRPELPAAIPEMLLGILGSDRAGTVVDLGCGTGLSTRIWVGKADRIVGIEPNDEMRHAAVERTPANAISFRSGSSYATGLAEHSADILTAVQAFHWMEPVATLEEVARVLRPGGLFAAIDNDWPPMVSEELDLAYGELFTHVRKLLADNADMLPRETQYPKDRHLENIRACTHFRDARELCIRSKEECSEERFRNLALSQGALQTLRKSKIEQVEPYVAAFDGRVRSAFAAGGFRTMWTNYRVRVGIRR